MKRLLLATLLLGGTVPLPAAEKSSAPDRAELVRWIVAHQDDLRDLSFAEVVKAATGKRVVPVDRKRDASLLRRLGRALDATLQALNQSSHPIHRATRVNEASHFIEDEIRRQVNRLPGWTCSIPRTSRNREQRSGYPDLRVVTTEGVVFYLDPKLYEADSRASTLRTFYYEPRALTGKIQDDAMHLLVGVEHSGGNAPLRLTKWELIDASKLRVNLKAEFQSSNAEIYKPAAIVGRSAK